MTRSCDSDPLLGFAVFDFAVIGGGELPPLCCSGLVPVCGAGLAPLCDAAPTTLCGAELAPLCREGLCLALTLLSWDVPLVFRTISASSVSVSWPTILDPGLHSACSGCGVARASASCCCKPCSKFCLTDMWCWVASCASSGTSSSLCFASGSGFTSTCRKQSRDGSSWATGHCSEILCFV